MKHFINIRDIPVKDLKKIIFDAKKRKAKRKNLNNLDTDKDIPLKGKLLIQMFEKSSLRTRLSFYLAIRQLGGGVLNLRTDELHLFKTPIIIGENGIPIIEGNNLKNIKKKLLETIKFDDNLYFKYEIK